METLAARVAREGPLNERDAVGWVIRLCKRVEELHTLGVAHGGISAHLVLTAAKECSGSGSLGDVRDAVITPSYHCPERVGGQGISVADDTWAIAVTLYYALTGTMPFPGSSPDEIRERLASSAPAPLAVFDVGDDDLQGILDRFLARDAAERTVQCRQLRDALEGWHPDPMVRSLPPLDDGAEDSFGDFDDDEEEHVQTVMRDFSDVREQLKKMQSEREQAPQSVTIPGSAPLSVTMHRGPGPTPAPGNPAPGGPAPLGGAPPNTQRYPGVPAEGGQGPGQLGPGQLAPGQRARQATSLGGFRRGEVPGSLGQVGGPAAQPHPLGSQVGQPPRPGSRGDTPHPGYPGAPQPMGGAPLRPSNPAFPAQSAPPGIPRPGGPQLGGPQLGGPQPGGPQGSWPRPPAPSWGPGPAGAPPGAAAADWQRASYQSMPAVQAPPGAARPSYPGMPATPQPRPSYPGPGPVGVGTPHTPGPAGAPRSPGPGNLGMPAGYPGAGPQGTLAVPAGGPPRPGGGMPNPAMANSAMAHPGPNQGMAHPGGALSGDSVASTPIPLTPGPHSARPAEPLGPPPAFEIDSIDEEDEVATVLMDTEGTDLSVAIAEALRSPDRARAAGAGRNGPARAAPAHGSPLQGNAIQGPVAGTARLDDSSDAEAPTAHFDTSLIARAGGEIPALPPSSVNDPQPPGTPHTLGTAGGPRTPGTAGAHDSGVHAGGPSAVFSAPAFPNVQTSAVFPPPGSGAFPPSFPSGLAQAPGPHAGGAIADPNTVDDVLEGLPPPATGAVPAAAQAAAPPLMVQPMFEFPLEPPRQRSGLKVALIIALVVLVMVVLAVVLLYLDRQNVIDLGLPRQTPAAPAAPKASP